MMIMAGNKTLGLKRTVFNPSIFSFRFKFRKFNLSSSTTYLKTGGKSKPRKLKSIQQKLKSLPCYSTFSRAGCVT